MAYSIVRDILGVNILNALVKLNDCKENIKTAINLAIALGVDAYKEFRKKHYHKLAVGDMILFCDGGSSVFTNFDLAETAQYVWWRVRKITKHQIHFERMDNTTYFQATTVSASMEAFPISKESVKYYDPSSLHFTVPCVSFPNTFFRYAVFSTQVPKNTKMNTFVVWKYFRNGITDRLKVLV